MPSAACFAKHISVGEGHARNALLSMTLCRLHSLQGETSIRCLSVGTRWIVQVSENRQEQQITKQLCCQGSGTVLPVTLGVSCESMAGRHAASSILVQLPVEILC